LASGCTYINKKISLLKQKHEQLVQYKKGIMQHLFSEQLRFKDDDGQDFPDWKVMKIGELFSNRSTKFNGDDELLSVTMNNGIKKRSEIAGKDNSSDDKSNYKKVCRGDIVYNSMRMWQGASGLSPYDGVVSPAYTVVSPNDLASGVYFSYFFKHEPVIHIFRRNSQGLTSDTWNLKYPQFSSIKFRVPSFKEQLKIEKFLETIDQKINLAQQQIEQTQAYKQGLLQQIFV
jgi:type I restriction enzyme S subunit